MSEARKIAELEDIDQLNQKKVFSGLKTHDEILELFEEIESIEDTLKHPETIEEELIKPETVEQEPVQPEKTGELADEIVFIEVPPESEIKKKKPKRLKIRRFLRFKKEKPGEISESTELQDQLEEPKGEFKPISSTFTLRIDDQDGLVGLNIKKPKPPREKKHIRLPFKKKAAKEPKSEEKIEATGIKGKLLRIVSRIKPKKSEGEGGSKISNIAGKIKGIFSRKSKE